MISQNPNEIRDKVFYRIKELISEFLHIDTVEKLRNNHEKIKFFYEKSVFLKELHEEGILSNQQEKDAMDSVSEWMSSSDILMDIHDSKEIIPDKKENLHTADLVVEKGSEVLTKNEITNEEISEQKVKLESIKSAKLTPVTEEKNTNMNGGGERKSVFNVDLNDRITFLKTLFSGDEVQMTNTLNKLYNSKTLLDANEYLSEIYHDRNWTSVDEYAQRLWALVERRFQ